MADLRAGEELWATNMLPEGIVERWLVSDGAPVLTGQVLVEVRVEDARHELIAPASGRIAILARINSIIEPGTLLATIEH